MAMRGWKKWIALTAVLFVTVLVAGNMEVSAKTKKVTLDLRNGGEQIKRPAALERAKKVRLKNSKKSVVKVQYKKNHRDKRLVFRGRKKGTATVTLKCTLRNKKIKTYKYKIKVIKSKKVTALDKAKKAFQIQNQYRKEKGVAALEWSDELYQFCLYRLKTSGFDGHKNLGRDTSAYFGLYSKFKRVKFAENMHSGYSDAESAMRSLKNSPKHYQNIINSSYRCGAVACQGGVWCVIFYSGDKNEIESWRNYQIKEITVKRYDSIRGAYIGGCSIGYYEADDRWGTSQAATISEESGKSIYLEIGKTYIIYERKTPDGCGKAERVTITVTEDGANEVVLTG